MSEVLILGLIGLIMVLAVARAGVEHAKVKFGNTNELAKQKVFVRDLQQQVEKMEKDRLRERVSRLESASGMDIFK